MCQSTLLINFEDEILLRLQRKQELKKPTKSDQNSLYNLIDTSESLLHSESQWIRQSDDLLALARDSKRGWLSTLIAKTLIRISKRFTLVCLMNYPPLYTIMIPLDGASCAARSAS